MLTETIPDNFQEAYNRYHRLVFIVIYKILKNEEDAEDLCQEVFISAYKKLDTFDEGRATFKTWLCTVAKNAAIDRYRYYARKRQLGLIDKPVDELIDLANNEPRQDKVLESTEAVKSLMARIAVLPKQLKQVITMRASGMKYIEIARYLNIPEGTVKNNIHRARKFLLQTC